MVESLTSGYSALVMASGIVSLGLSLTGHETLSIILFAVGIVAYITLCTLKSLAV